MQSKSAPGADVFPSFGALLRFLRRRAYMSQRELAIATGYSEAQVSRLESNLRAPDAVAVLARFVPALDLDDEPDLIARLMELAAPARTPSAATSAIRDTAAGPGEAATSTPMMSQRVDNLPASTTPFIGRESELQTLDGLLRRPDVRLVTLLGPGGIGKTRLALEAAGRHRAHFADGASIVLLAPVSAPESIVPAIAEALRLVLTSRAGHLRELLSSLGGKELLLVLDNFEHLTAGADLLNEILMTAPRVKLLVTSRERLSLRGEWTMDLEGLEVPPDPSAAHIEQFSAVQLFVGSARRLNPRFDLIAADQGHIARLCTLLEGSPLAIELAASWTRTLSCAEILEEIRRDLDVLTTTMRDLPARHASMRAVFDHSWRLLTDDERDALQKLAVFRGGFDRVAALEVTEARLPLLRALVDKSLLRPLARRDSVQRYDLHELVRQYADEKLVAHALAQPTRDRHLQYFLHMAEEAEPHLVSSTWREWLQRLDLEHDNLRAALDWSRDETPTRTPADADACLRLVGALWRFWFLRGHFEEWDRWLGVVGAEDWTVRAAKGETGLVATHRAKVLLGRAMRAWSEQDWLRATSLCEESLGLSGETGNQWSGIASLIILGRAYVCVGQATLGRPLLDQGATVARADGDPWLIAFALMNLGDASIWQDHVAKARACYEESVLWARKSGDSWLMAHALNGLGGMVAAQHDDDRAALLFAEGLALRRELGDKLGMACSLQGLANVAMRRDDPEAARIHAEERLRIEQELGNRRGVAPSLGMLGEIAAMQGAISDARALGEQSLALWRELGDRGPVGKALLRLARVERVAGDSRRARELLAESMALFDEVDDQRGVTACRDELAALA